MFSFDSEWLAVQCTSSQWRWPSAIFFCWVVYTSVSANYSRLVWTCSSLLTGMRSLTFFISFFSSLYLCWNVICHTILYEMMNEEFNIEFACEEFNISTCTFYSFGQTFLFFFFQQSLGDLYRVWTWNADFVQFKHDTYFFKCINTGHLLIPTIVYKAPGYPDHGISGRRVPNVWL